MKTKTAIMERGRWCEEEECEHLANSYCIQCDKFTCKNHAGKHVWAKVPHEESQPEP